MIRVELLSGPRAFLMVVACVLAPLGAWLPSGAAGRAAAGRPEPAESRRCSAGARRRRGRRDLRHRRGLDPGADAARARLAVCDVAGAALLRPSSPRSRVWSPTRCCSSSTEARSRRIGRSGCRWAWPASSAAMSAPAYNPMPETLIRRLLGVLVLIIAVRYLSEGLAG